MEEIVKKNVLDAVHHILRNQRQYLDEEKMLKADELIIPYIEENFEYTEDEFKVKKFGSPVLVGDKRIYPICIRYYAIMQDNLSLLSKLEESDYSFVGMQHIIKFFALDKQLSNKFKEKDYIRYLKKHSDCIEHFYNTLRGLDHHHREKVLKEFSEIVKSDPTTLNVGDGEDSFYNFLTRRNIELFGKEFLLSMDEKQRNLINTFYFQIDESNVSSIKELVVKYPDIKIPIPLYRDILKLFTIDELATLSDKDIELYLMAAKANLIHRMKQLLEENPSFNCPKEFIRYEIFKVLDNETILGLSYETMEKIANIKYVEIDNVYVFPIKKINSIIKKENHKSILPNFHRK